MYRTVVLLMDFAEFKRMLLEALKESSIKSEVLKLLSDDGVSARIEEYEKKIAELTEKLEQSALDADIKYKELSGKLNESEAAAAAVRTELEAKEKQIADLSESLAKAASMETDSQKIAEDRIARLTRELDEMRSSAAEKDAKLSELDALKAASAEKDAKISDLTASETALKAQLSSLSAAADDMKSHLESSDSEKNAQISKLTEKVTALTAELETEKAQGTQRAEAAANSAAEIEKLKAEAAELSAKLGTEKNQLAQKTDALTAANNEIERLKNANEEVSGKLSAALAKANDIEAAANVKNEELSRSVADMNVKIADYVSELDKAKADIEQKDNAIAELKKAAAESEAAVAEKTASISAELNDAKSKAAQAEAEIAAAKTAAEQTAAKLADTEAKLAAAQQDVSHKDATIANMNNQLQAMLVLRQKINEYAETANAYAEEVENARSILAERDAKINTLEAQINPLSAKVDELTERLQQYAEALTTKNEQVEEISNYAESLKAHAEECQNAVLTVQAELNQKIEETAKMEKDIDAYNRTFGNLTQMLDKYNNLAPSTKAGLADVFPENLDVRSFLSSGAQWGHIQALWEYTQQKINSEDLTDVKTLNAIFSYFLDFHNSSYPAPLYALLDTKPGDAFDEEQHAKLMTREERKNAFFAKKGADKPEGPVKEVVLYGYKNLKNGRVLKPSVVKV